MERRINWYSGCHDEIELVYGKANENENIAATLMELETMALQEAEESCGMLKMGDKPITREMFLAMSEQDKETVMYYLSGAGLQEFVPSMTEGKITVTFTPHIQRVLGCTMFSVLNRLEKLDGAFNVMFPKATLELRVPLGAKKGMMKCEMLIMQLYPWLSITETSTNTVSGTLDKTPTPDTPVVKRDELIGTVVDKKYEVLKLLNDRGLFKIYLASDLRVNKLWAIKVCNKTDRHYGPVIHEAIMREAHMMMKLNHPAIPRMVDIIESDKSIFIFREFVEGETLDTIVRMYGSQPADKVVEWAKQLCDVLGYLHTLTPPHIYRDMKPANIIIMPDGRLKLIDFGIMRMYDSTKNEDTCNLGTKGYAAPEQYGGKGQSDARTDIFGLGMTMYNLVTGVNPNDPPYEIRPIRQVNAELPKKLEEIICKCIEPNPEKRYQSCDALLKDLDKCNTEKSKGRWSKIFGRK